MSLIIFLAEVADKLESLRLEYALAGGLAVSLYRVEPRTTKDLDFVISADVRTHEVAKEVISSFGLTPTTARKADLDGGPLFAIKRKSSPPCIVVGRNKGDAEALGLDFLLPELPWAPSALARAQSHLVDFGIRKIPTLTVEDVILAKLTAAARPGSKRLKDLDDLQSIFSRLEKYDEAYMVGQMRALRLEVPREVLGDVPDDVRLASREVGKLLKRERQAPQKSPKSSIQNPTHRDHRPPAGPDRKTPPTGHDKD